MENNRVTRHNFGYGMGNDTTHIKRSELKDEQDLKDYLIDITKTNAIDEKNIEFVTDNILIMPNAILRIEKATD